jgi:hypothetical protein
MRAADPGFSVEEAIALLGADLELRLNREQVTALVESLTERELEVLRLLGPEIGRGFHPSSPPSGGRAPPATPPS